MQCKCKEDVPTGLCFELHCTPTAQQRPRHMTTHSGIHRAYKSGSQKANERTLEAMLMPHVPKMALEGALELQFVASLPVPSSVTKRQREAMLCGKIRPTVKPDLDNVTKQLKDSMTRMHFWHDDKQVVRMVCEKVYAECGMWAVTVRVIGEGRQK